MPDPVPHPYATWHQSMRDSAPRPIVEAFVDAGYHLNRAVEVLREFAPHPRDWRDPAALRAEQATMDAMLSALRKAAEMCLDAAIVVATDPVGLPVELDGAALKAEADANNALARRDLRMRGEVTP